MLGDLTCVQQRARYGGCMQPRCTWHFFLYSSQVSVVLADPLGACSSLFGDYTNVIALIDLGSAETCDLNQRAIYARDAGAVAVIFIRNDTSFSKESPAPLTDVILFGVINQVCRRMYYRTGHGLARSGSHEDD